MKRCKRLVLAQVIDCCEDSCSDHHYVFYVPFNTGVLEIANCCNSPEGPSAALFRIDSDGNVEGKIWVMEDKLDNPKPNVITNEYLDEHYKMENVQAIPQRILDHNVIKNWLVDYPTAN